MTDSATKRRKKGWIRKLRNKYRLVLMNADTYEEKFSFRLSRLNVIVLSGSIVIVLIVLTTYVIAFTPLREYIPGYTSVAFHREVQHLRQKADSLEIEFARRHNYLNSIRMILGGGEIGNVSTGENETFVGQIQDAEYYLSAEDSLLRAEYERESAFSLYYTQTDVFSPAVSPLGALFFFNPLEGIITSEFNLSTLHFGVDIVANENEAVKATLDGSVIFADWTVATGYVIAIQHQGNFLSMYKHNSVLLKNAGNLVKAGEPIAIVGSSGELSTGPHLHFELWYNGAPVDPRNYIAF